MDVLPTQARRWHIIGGLALILVLLIAGIFIQRQRQRAAHVSAPAGVCAPAGNANSAATLIPPDDTLPATLPAGEPRVIATVNGDTLYAEGLELRVAATLANDRQALQKAQQGQPGSLPPNVLASLERTPNQVATTRSRK
ncbi:MAG TPA: hypothetical protein VGS80_13365 [Ktedonobacterales bacterium]|nr:hypothetical protein [Ktedonobacterales bacterium]